MTRTPILVLALCAFALPAAAQEESAQETQGGTGALVNAEGQQLGNVSASTTASGVILVLVNAEGFPEGVHGVHLHMAGDCTGPVFESAGDHIPGEMQHGVRTDDGPHPGDLPNAHVGADGVLAMEAFAVGLSEEMLYDEDGSALIVHANPDDYQSQPSGESGDPIACAVIEPAPGTMTDDTVDPSATEDGAATETPEGGEAPAEGEDQSGG
jgi:Cu-Zn family superoxide dismutase